MTCIDTTCEDEIFLGDTGTSIEFLIYECDDTDPCNPVKNLADISSATSYELTFLKPDKTSLIKTDPEVKFLTDGTDSLIHYITIDTDLDLKGNWKAQLRVTMPTGKWYASVISFKVLKKLV